MPRHKILSLLIVTLLAQASGLLAAPPNPRDPLPGEQQEALQRLKEQLGLSDDGTPPTSPSQSRPPSSQIDPHQAHSIFQDFEALLHAPSTSTSSSAPRAAPDQLQGHAATPSSAPGAHSPPSQLAGPSSDPREIQREKNRELSCQRAIRRQEAAGRAPGSKKRPYNQEEQAKMPEKMRRDLEAQRKRMSSLKASRAKPKAEQPWNSLKGPATSPANKAFRQLHYRTRHLISRRKIRKVPLDRDLPDVLRAMISPDDERVPILAAQWQIRMEGRKRTRASSNAASEPEHVS